MMKRHPAYCLSCGQPLPSHVRELGPLVGLAAREQHILWDLIRHSPKVLPPSFWKRSALYLAEHATSDTTIRGHISRIRSALREVGSPWYINTVWGRGYQARKIV